jgi:hypothetical protein
MTKADLKTGMLVETKKGEFGIILLGTREGDVIASDGNDGKRHWGYITNYYDDLSHINSSDDDIVRIYDYCVNMDGVKFSIRNRKLLWERKENEKVKLNDQYTAEIDLNRSVVKVGCQEISFFNVASLYHKMMRATKQ